MSREAAIGGLETFVHETVDATRQEFRVANVLRGTGLGPGAVLIDQLRKNADALERQVVEPELDVYRRRSVEQLRVVVRYTESERPIDAFEAELLEHDGYLDALDPNVSPARRQAVTDDVLARLERLGDGIEPVVRRPEEKFWPAVRAAFDRDEALELVDDVFPFTGPLWRHREAFTFTVEVDPGEVLGGPFAGSLPSASLEYTDEAIRAMRRAEQRVVQQTKTTVETQFVDGTR